MKSCLKKFSLGVLILLAGFVLFSSTVLAQTAPYAIYSGGAFNYDTGTNELTISGGTIGWVQHVDGSFAFMPGQDSVWGGTFSFSGLFNGDAAGENWIFAPSVGSPDFTLYDYLGVQVLSAEINDFTVVQNGSLYEVNVSFDQDNVGPITVNPSYSGTSEFVSDVNSFSPPWGNLYMKFSFSGTGATDFTEDQYGSVTGTFAVAPEPISSILFVTGGATLAFRRFRRKRSI